MANQRKKNEILSIQHAPFILGGSYSVTTSEVVVKVQGQGFSVTNTSTGVYTVSLSNTYPNLVSAVRKCRWINYC